MRVDLQDELFYDDETHQSLRMIFIAMGANGVGEDYVVLGGLELYGKWVSSLDCSISHPSLEDVLSCPLCSLVLHKLQASINGEP